MEHYIERAIVCGPKPIMRDWRSIEDLNELTTAEQVMKFAEMYLIVPSGPAVGESLKFDPFQEAFMYSVFDNPAKTRVAILSVARRNSKSFITAVILLAYLVGPLAALNSVIASAANSRDQAAIVFKFMSDIIMLSGTIRDYIKVSPSSKAARGLTTNTEYFAMSSDARTGLGRSLRVVVLDESGQIKGPDNSFVSMLRTSQGSYEDPLFITISTQAPSDADYLSVMIDDSIRAQDPRTVTHVYETPEEMDILDEDGWQLSNPGIDTFRSRSDLREQLTQADRIPALRANAENLLLNRRVSLTGLWLAPHIWKANNAEIDLRVFKENIVVAGLDLSNRQDLTACIFAARDDTNGHIHVLPFVFTPQLGLEERANRDRAPYLQWVRDGKMFAVPGATISYEWVALFLKRQCEKMGINVAKLCFDRWRIENFKTACAKDDVGWEPDEWSEVGQGYKDMSPRVEAFESVMLREIIHHGNHPLLTMAAANAISTQDPSGNRKLDKSASTQRIDPLVAAVMAVFPLTDGEVLATTSVYEDESRAMIM